MNNTKFFLHIDPLQWNSLSVIQTETLSQGSGPLASTISDADDLAIAAMAFFRGVFPKQTAYFFWGEGSALPWYGDYDHNGISNDRQRVALAAEIDAIAGELKGLAGPSWLKEPTSQLTYQSPVLCESTQLKVQGLIVETLLCVDGLLDRLACRRPNEALDWQRNAYQNLIEALSQAHELPRSHQSVVTLH